MTTSYKALIITTALAQALYAVVINHPTVLTTDPDALASDTEAFKISLTDENGNVLNLHGARLSADYYNLSFTSNDVADLAIIGSEGWLSDPNALTRFLDLILISMAASPDRNGVQAILRADLIQLVDSVQTVEINETYVLLTEYGQDPAAYEQLRQLLTDTSVTDELDDAFSRLRETVTETLQDTFDHLNEVIENDTIETDASNEKAPLFNRFLRKLRTPVGASIAVVTVTASTLGVIALLKARQVVA